MAAIPPVKRDREYSLLIWLEKGDDSLDRVKALVSERAGELPSTVTVEISVNNLTDADQSLAGEIDSSASIPGIVIALRQPGQSSDGKELAALAADCFRGIVAVVGEWLDDAVVMAADRCQLLEGFGPVRIFYGIRRLPHLSRDAFQNYWLNTHGDIGRALLAPYSYIQSHVLAGASAELARRSGLPATDLDGVVNIHFPDMSAFTAQTSRQEVADIALADERNFIDHSRVQFGVMSTFNL